MITSKRVGAIMKRYEDLMDLAKTFANERHKVGRRGEVRIGQDGIEEHVNTACHCHPEYEWITRGSLEEFYEWIDKRPGGTD